MPKKKQRAPRISENNFLDHIKWVNWRTIASLNMPCSICGSLHNVAMHHVKHVRKTKYSLIPQPAIYQKVMSLRNRKQIPVCAQCQDQIHSGKYNQNKVGDLFTPQLLYDNRTLIPENYVQKGTPFKNAPLEKRLIENEWKPLEN